MASTWPGVYQFQVPWYLQPADLGSLVSLTNEFQEWLPTSNFDFSENITLCHLARVHFCERAPRLIDALAACSWAEVFCKPGTLSVCFPQALDLLSWLTLVHQLTPPKHSSVVDLQGVYQLKTAWQGGWFMIDPEKCWSPYTASQATLAECLRET